MQNQNFDIQDFISFLANNGHRIGNSNVIDLVNDEENLQDLYKRLFIKSKSLDVADIKTMVATAGTNEKMTISDKHKALKLILNLNFNNEINANYINNM